MNPSPDPDFRLVIIGDEILSGKRTDKHLPKVIELLGARGLQLACADYVGDDPELITATLKRAFDSGAVVFSCGGIGATPDDHTRQCAARALGVPLELHPQAEALIRERMQDTAREQGIPYEPDRPDNIHRLNMGVFPSGAGIIPNPFNKIPGFSVRYVHFVPVFPVMAWPMIEWVLDQRYAHLFRRGAYVEKSVIVFGAMEATLTPLMEAVERDHPEVKVFSLPSVDHPQWGRHIDLGVKGPPLQVEPAYAQLLAGLQAAGVRLGPELVRPLGVHLSGARLWRTVSGRCSSKRAGPAKGNPPQMADNPELCRWRDAPALAQKLHPAGHPIDQQPSNLEKLMAAKTVADVMKMVKENEVKFVDFRFTDTRGKEQHVTVPVSHFDEDKFSGGHAFDGSSIAGWKGIEASDMLLMPDPNTANIDPFFEETTLLLSCDVL